MGTYQDVSTLFQIGPVTSYRILIFSTVKLTSVLKQPCLIGVISYGYGCPQSSDDASVYVRVKKYLPWIQQVVPYVNTCIPF